MTSTFRASLVNLPQGDPCLYVEIFREGRALLFDLGDIRALPNRKILKVSFIFITHAHIDHFIGFDLFLRIHMGKGKEVTIFGPRGITARVRSKLNGYTWNLIKGQQLKFIVVEVLKNKRRITEFRCSEKFRGIDRGEVYEGRGILIQEPHWTVRAEILDHGIPSLGFAIEEKIHLNVRKDVMLKKGYLPGEWLTKLKEKIRKGELNEEIVVPFRDGYAKRLKVDELYKSLIIEKEGEKISYISDVNFTKGNLERILNLCRDSSILFCEAHFTSKDEKKALETGHLTALQSAKIAKLTNSKKLVIFHFSQKYEGDFSPLYREASTIFNDIVVP